MKFLLVEDDLDIAENVIQYCERHGFLSDYAMTGEVAIALLRENRYDAVVLDVTLPGMNGFEVCTEIRKQLRSKVPVIMLTARTMLRDKMDGFEAGADDYLTKPFNIEELRLRLTALCRRASQNIADIFRVGDLSLDPDSGVVMRGDTELNLSPVAFNILKRLMEAYPNCVSREDLEYSIWKDTPPVTDALKAHFYLLRQLVDKPFGRQLLFNVRGKGYRISLQGEDGMECGDQ